MIGRSIGNYVVLQKVGSGGMGTVYMAEHPRIKRRVAIKVLRSEMADDPEALARFFTEARSTSEIHNEHIIQMLDFGEFEDAAPYLVMEWLEGTTLTRYLADNPRPPWERIVHILAGIGSALTAAHECGVVHRDLKPDNIFLVKKGADQQFVKVLDFGIAKLLDQKNSTYKTRTNSIVGTPAYMSPEQCNSAHESIDGRSDIYSLGVIAYQMITGRIPFDSPTPIGLITAHATQPPPPLRSIDPAIPAGVEAAVLSALEKSRDKRFQHATDLVAAIANEVGVALPASLPPMPRSSVNLKAADPVPADPAVWRSQTLASQDTPSRSALQAPAPGSAGAPDTLGAAAAEVRPTAARSSYKALAYGVAAAGALAVIILMALPTMSGVRRPARQPEPAAIPAVAPPPAAAPSPIPLPAASAAPPAPITRASSQVTLSIRTEPPEAEVFLDEAPLPNPFSGSFARSDVRHHVVAKLRGYHTSSTWEVFDRDRSLQMTLKAATVGTPAPATKSTRPAAAAKPAPERPKAPPAATPDSARARPMHTDDPITPDWNKDK